MQLVTAIEPTSRQQTAFTWDIQIKNKDTIVFSIQFAEPSVISQMGIDRDALRIFFEESASIITCLPTS